LERPDVGWTVTKTHVLQIRINGFRQIANASINPYARKTQRLLENATPCTVRIFHVS